MRIPHVAIWTADLERLRAFYERHLGATAGRRYVNAAKGFSSYFLQFESGALSVGSREDVVGTTERRRAAGVPVVDGPRVTGDGYLESVVLDPDGNRIELTA